MTRKQELLDKLKKSPTDRQACDSMVAFHAQRNDFNGLYESLVEVVESISNGAVLAEFQMRLMEVLRKHLGETTDPALGAALKLRLARQLFDQGSDQRQALILIAEAFDRLPSDESASRAVDMLRESGEPLLLIRLLRRKAEAERGTERYKDTYMQLGFVALGAEYTQIARSTFEELMKSDGSASEKARERLRVVDKKETELRLRVKELTDKLAAATGGEREAVQLELGKVYVRLGEYLDAIAVLEELLAKSRSDEGFKELRDAYREMGEWKSLVALVEKWAAGASAEDRKELLKERVRLYCDQLNDQASGFRAVEELFSGFPGVQDVVLFCANLYAEFDNPQGQASLLARARQETKDRDQERHYLEWEAAVRWRRLGELEEAERLYRRIKSIDPRNEPSLLFYEDYYRQQGDFRKLYSILSNRQALVEDEAKVDVLRSMADIALKHLASPDRAIDALKKVLTLKPEDEEAFQQLASLLEEGKRWHAVIEHYTTKLERLPEGDAAGRLECLRRILDVYTSPDKLPVAEMVVTTQRRILQLDPGNPQVLGSLSDFYRRASRWGELVEVLERRVESEKSAPALKALHQEIARILMEHQHQEAPAIPHLEEVVRLDSKDVAALRLLTRAHRGRGNQERLFETGQALLPLVSGVEAKELLEELATVALDRLGEVERGAALLSELVRMEPNHPWAGRRLWQAYEKAERWSDLASALRQALATTQHATEKRELKERLAVLLADHLEQYEEAQRLFQELLEENQANRQAQRYLERILAHKGDFETLRSLYEKQRNLPGLGRFFDEYLQKETQAERLWKAGQAYLRVLDHDLKDAEKVRSLLRLLMERLPEEIGVAREILARWPAESPDLVVAAAWGVVAKHEKGPKSLEAGLKAAEMMERLGKHGEALGATQAVVRQQAAEGRLEALGLLVERAERAGKLPEVLLDLDEVRMGMGHGAQRLALGVQLAEMHRTRTRDLAAGVAILRGDLEWAPESLELLDGLERLCTEQNDWEGVEEVLQSKIPLLQAPEVRREELFKLARLYEMGENREMAASVFRQIREVFPNDAEAFEGLQRVLEELGDYTELALLLEERLRGAEAEHAWELCERLVGILRGSLHDSSRAAAVLGETSERFPSDVRYTVLLREMFDSDEVLEEVIPVLEQHYRRSNDHVELAQVLIRRSDITKERKQRYESLRECVRIFWEKLEQAGAAFSMIRRVVAIDPSSQDVLDDLELLGREAGEEVGLFDVYKGLLGIGESSFESEGEVPPGQRVELAKRLAALADQLGDEGVGIGGLKAVWAATPEDDELGEALMERLEAAGRHEELLEVLEVKRDLVSDAEASVGYYLRGADVLESQMSRPGDAIAWLEQASVLGKRRGEVEERLDRLYAREGRWSELADLLDGIRQRESGPQGVEASLRLAHLCSSKLNQPARALAVLSALYAAKPDSLEVYEAMVGLLALSSSEEFGTISEGLVGLLEPAAERREDWNTLVDVLRVKVGLQGSAETEAKVWWKLAQVSHDSLRDVAQAFDALVRALSLDASSAELVEKARLWARGMGRQLEVANAILAGLGDLSLTDNLEALVAVDGLLSEAAGSQEMSIDVLDRLVELCPERKEYSERLDGLLERSGDTGRRIRFLERALDSTSGLEQVQTRWALSQLLFSQERMEEAADCLLAGLANVGMLDEETRHLVFGLLIASLEQSERWFDLADVLQKQLDWTTETDERKAILFRAAALQEGRLDNPEKAIELYRALVGLDPNEQSAMESLTRLLSEVGRFRELEDILANQVHGLESAEERRGTLVALAKLRLEELREPEGALDALVSALEEGALDPTVEALLGSIREEYPDTGFRASQVLETGYRSAKDWRRLSDVLLEQVETYSQEVDCAERYRELAEIARDQFADLPKAFEYFGLAFQHDPDSQVLYEDLLELARATGKQDELFELVLEVLALHESASGRVSLRKRAVAFFNDELKDVAKAERLYRDMVEEDPADDWALERLETLYREESSWERLAETLVARAGLASSKEVRIGLLFELASLYRSELGSAEQAIDVLEEILSLDVHQWDAYRAMEDAYESNEDTDGAVATLRRELQYRTVPEERKEAQIRLVIALMGQEDAQEAGVEADALVRAFPDDEDALNLLFEAMQKWEQATPDAVARLEGALRQREDLERLVALYQVLASRALTPEERVSWLERMYEARVERAGDARGAYAALKIMVHSIPEEREKRRALIGQAQEVGELEDALEFLVELAESRELQGSESAGEIELEVAQVLDSRLGRPEEALVHYVRASDAGNREVASEARGRLLALYEATGSYEELVSLLEAMALESSEIERRREWLVRATETAAGPLGDSMRALTLLRPLAEEMEADEEIQARYEALLQETDQIEELETFLCRRLASGLHSEEESELRVRLATLLLTRTDRPDEGSEEALRTLRTFGPLPHVSALVEQILEEETGAADVRLQLAEALDESLTQEHPVDLRILALRVRSTLETDEGALVVVHQRLADLLGEQEDWSGALRHLVEALRLAPSDESILNKARVTARERTLLAEWLEALETLEESSLESVAKVPFVLEAAQVLDETGQPDRAAAKWSKALEWDGQNGEALDRLLEFHRARENSEQVAKLLEVRIPLEPDPVIRAGLTMELARLFGTMEGKEADARLWWEELLVEPSVRADAIDALISLYQQAKEWDGLRELLSDALQRGEGGERRAVWLRVVAGLTEEHLDDPLGAISWYVELASMPGEALDAWEGVRRCGLASEDFERAAQADEELVGLVEEERQFELHQELANFYLDRLGKKTEGQVHLQLLLQYRPVPPEVVEMAFAWVDDPDIGMDLSLQLEPVFEENQEWDRLEELYEKQLAHLSTPEEKVPILVKSAEMVADVKGDLEKATAMLSALLEEVPGDEMVLERLGALSERTGDVGPFLRRLQDATETAPSTEVLVNLCKRIAAIYAEVLDDPDSATNWYRRVLEESPANPEAVAALEALYQKAGMSDELASFYDELLFDREGEERIPYLLKLGFLKEAQFQDAEGALDYYKEVISIVPEHPAALNRIEGFLEHPKLSLAAVEILEPIYRTRGLDERLARLLLVKAGEVEGRLDRAQILAEAASKLAKLPGKANEAFDTYLEAIRERSFDPTEVLSPAEELAEKLGAWDELVTVLDEAIEGGMAPELRAELRRRVALVYLDKLNVPAKAERHLKAILEGDPDNRFALNLLLMILERANKPLEQAQVLEQLGDLALDPAEKRSRYAEAAELVTNEGEPALAAQLLLKALTVSVTDLALMEKLAGLYRLLESWEALVDLLERQASLQSPEEAVATLLEAAHVASHSMEAPARASALAQLILGRDPDNIEALLIKRDALEGQGNHRELAQVLQRLAARATGEEQEGFLWEMHDLAVRQDDEEGAARVLARILALVPDSEKAQDAQIEQFRRRGESQRLAEALQNRAGTVRSEEQRLKLQLEAVEILANELGELEKASDLLAAVMDQYPEAESPLRMQGDLLLRQKRYSEAMEAFVKQAGLARTAEVRRDVLKRAAAIALEKLGDSNMAEEHARAAMSAGPMDGELLELLSQILARNGRHADLAALLEEQLRKETDAAARHAMTRRLAFIYRDSLGNSERFVTLLEEALSYQEDPEVVEELLKYYRGKGDAPRQVAMLERRAQWLLQRRQMKELPSILYEMGDLFEKLGELRRAVDAFERCVQADGSFLMGVYRLALLLARDDERKADALGYLQTVLLRINELPTTEDKVKVYLMLAVLFLDKGEPRRSKTYVTRLLALDKDHEDGKALLEHLNQL